MMKKKLFVMFVAMLFLFAGCGTDAKNQTATLVDETSESTEQENTDAKMEFTDENVISETEKATETDGMTTEQAQNDNTGDDETVMKMNVQINNMEFKATLEDNEAVSAFVDMMQNAPVVIQMSDYSGFEKVGALGTSLPTNNAQTTTHVGDIVLYNGNQIVIFYGSNSWSYTRLGKIDDLTGWEEALGNGDITATFSIE